MTEARPRLELPRGRPRGARPRLRASRPALRAAVGIAVLLGVAVPRPDAPALAAPDASTSPVLIRIESPQPGEVVRSQLHVAAIRGSAQSGDGRPIDFDVMIAIDVSHSTRFPSGIDVDEDGETGLNPHEELIAPGTHPEDVVCTDPDDTILAAEIQAARILLDVLRPGRTRVGLITFSGEVDTQTGLRLRADQQDAVLQVALTDDFDRVRAALDRVARRGPFGATDFAAAIRLSVRELAGLSGAESTPRADAKRVLLFLTDGVPTFPFGQGTTADPEDTEAAINAARLARKAGIAINSYALGRHALARPVAVSEMARITGGTFTPARNPGDIVGFLQGVSFANVDDVVITNLTTRDVSYDVSLSPDGSFAGFVPVSEGRNLIQVTALASDGAEGSVEFGVDFEKAGLSERELALELERVKKRNRELMLLLERERIQRFRDRQKKRVVIEAD